MFYLPKNLVLRKGKLILSPILRLFMDITIWHILMEEAFTPHHWHTMTTDIHMLLDMVLVLILLVIVDIIKNINAIMLVEEAYQVYVQIIRNCFVVIVSGEFVLNSLNVLVWQKTIFLRIKTMNNVMCVMNIVGEFLIEI